MNERERIIEYWRKRARECLLAAFNKEFVKTGKIDKELGNFTTACLSIEGQEIMENSLSLKRKM